MQTVIYHLIGPPGVGKYTIGRELAALTGARLVDNHSISNVLFNLLDQDGVKPLPREIWRRYGIIRQVVLETITNVSPLHLSFIFTNFLRGENEVELTVFRELAAVADARKSLFVPVVLACESDELMTRIGTESRRERLKLIDPVEGRRLNEGPVFVSGHANQFDLDVTSVPPEESARRIVEWAASLPGGDRDESGGASAGS